MILFWAAILAISTLLYVLLDGFDLGVGILTAAVRSDARREAMMGAIELIGDGKRDLARDNGRGALGRFSGRLCAIGALPSVSGALVASFFIARGKVLPNRLSTADEMRPRRLFRPTEL